MAGKKKDLEEATAEGIPAVEEQDVGTGVPRIGSGAGSAGPMPGPTTDYCILVNLTKSPLNCHLRNGKCVNLGPKVAGMDIHRSEPVLKRLRTDILFTWEKKGMLAFEAIGGDA